MLDRLKSHFYTDPTQHILPLAQARAVACSKAIATVRLNKVEVIQSSSPHTGPYISRTILIFSTWPEQNFQFEGSLPCSHKLGWYDHAIDM